MMKENLEKNEDYKKKINSIINKITEFEKLKFYYEFIITMENEK